MLQVTCRVITALVCASTALQLTGCALEQRMSTQLPSTFLEDVDRSAKKPNLPFLHSWSLPSATKSKYNTVFFKPVRTDLLPPDAWEANRNTLVTDYESYKETVDQIAQYFREQLNEEVKNHPGRFSVVDAPHPHTIVIEFAFTELQLSHPVLRAASLAAPIPGTGIALTTMSDPHVAFAARVTDGTTRRLLATLADRKFPPSRLIDLNKLSVSSSAREVCSLWAETIAQALQSDPSTAVSEQDFSLLPW